MNIRRVSASRSDRRRFVSFPRDLYRHEPRWVPPMRADELKALHPSHLFYRHSAAAFFLAEDAGRTVGRIGVLDHRGFNEVRAANTAFFGYFEAIDDQTTADSLFGAAGSWASDRGLTSLVGPRGLLPSDGRGVLVEGFELPPTLGLPFHHPYYDRLIRGAGLNRATDYLSGRVQVSRDAPDQVLAAADAAAAANGYELKTFNSKRDLKPWLLRIGRILDESMVDNWGYTPADDTEIEAMGKRILPIVDPHLILLLMQSDEIVGYLLLLPDVGDAIQASGGRLLPLGWARLVRASKRTRKVTIPAMGLIPEHRGTGANLVLYAALTRHPHRHLFDTAEVVQVEEGNIPMMRNMQTLDVPWNRRHRMYQRQL